MLGVGAMERPTALPGTDTRRLLSIAAALSAGLLLGSRPRRPSTARTAATVGAAALAMLAFVMPSSNVIRKAGKRRRAGHLRFSVVIPRPVEQVFALCADFENFPRLIKSLRRVTDYGDGRSLWCAITPAGGTIEWDSVTTKYVTNSVIGWESAPGAAVKMSGLLRFAPAGQGTCVRIALDYEVLSSNLRDAFAALLAPRNAPKLERQIRALAFDMTASSQELAGELPHVVSSAAASPASAT